MRIRDVITWAGLGSVVTLAAVAAWGLPLTQSPDSRQIERGRYLVKIGGCNDCHTAGYTQAAGKVPETNWLTGGDLGFRGPWGTTYASNLRMLLNTIPEDQWVHLAHTAEFRPPMPWFNLHAMSEDDLRAIHRFVRHLGPAGGPVRVYLPPDREPSGPHAVFPSPPK